MHPSFTGPPTPPEGPSAGGLSQCVPLAHRSPEKPWRTFGGRGLLRCAPLSHRFPEKSLGLLGGRGLPQCAPLAWSPPPRVPPEDPLGGQGPPGLQTSPTGGPRPPLGMLRGRGPPQGAPLGSPETPGTPPGGRGLPSIPLLRRGTPGTLRGRSPGCAPTSRVVTSSLSEILSRSRSFSSSSARTRSM